MAFPASRPGLHDWLRWLASHRHRAHRAEQDRRRRELARLDALPRYQSAVTDITGRRLELADGPSFVWTYDEIYKEGIYAFHAQHPTPYIVDGGANIGMSVLYFKELYPASEIVAFEPDPALFAVLERNVASARVSGVRLVAGALWSSETTLAFHPEGADGGHLVADGEAATITVKTVRLGDYLDRPVDLLKLDIEGAETEVLLAAADHLPQVERLYVEYHSRVGERQTLPELLSVLRDAGFRLHLLPCGVSPRPFLAQRDYQGLDLQLHVFGVRS